jgi:hypothetical protein
MNDAPDDRARALGWVYVIEAVGQHLFKVGLTAASPESRLRQLQTGSPHKLEILAAFTCEEPQRVEAELHRFLGSYAGSQRSNGEWFSLTREAILEILMTLFAKLARGCSRAGHDPALDLEAIRDRALRATEGRSNEKERYSVFEVEGCARVGDIGATCWGEIEVPFKALAIGGPTHPEHNDHVIALIPKIHGNSAANAEFFANANYDVLALVKEIERLTRPKDD